MTPERLDHIGIWVVILMAAWWLLFTGPCSTDVDVNTLQRVTNVEDRMTRIERTVDTHFEWITVLCNETTSVTHRGDCPQ